jgi:transcriptional regulator with XRE-family HTH domain
MSFADRLVQERKRLGLTQQAMATIGGLKRTSQHLYESGARVPDLTYLLAIREAGADLAFLLDGLRPDGTGPAPLAKALGGRAFRAVAEHPQRDSLSIEEQVRLFEMYIDAATAATEGAPRR